MFSHYDQNNNGALEREELEQVCSQAAVTVNLQNCAVDTVWWVDVLWNLSH
jgi:Ca2+-binding EF-hand superfamily protein